MIVLKKIFELFPYTCIQCGIDCAYYLKQNNFDFIKHYVFVAIN